MKKVMFTAALFTCVLLTSCTKDVEEELNPIDTCVTESMSFKNDILPIFTTNCNGCHGADTNFGGITLDNFDDTKSVISAGRLLGAINRDAGFSPMPQSADKLSECNINKLDSWIADGALNN